MRTLIFFLLEVWLFFSENFFFRRIDLLFRGFWPFFGSLNFEFDYFFSKTLIFLRFDFIFWRKKSLFLEVFGFSSEKVYLVIEKLLNWKAVEVKHVISFRARKCPRWFSDGKIVVIDTVSQIKVNTIKISRIFFVYLTSRLLGVTPGVYLIKHSFGSWWAQFNDTQRSKFGLVIEKLLKFNI